jgi:hypothetical protein
MKKTEIKTIEAALLYTGRKVADLKVFQSLSSEKDAKHHEADFRLKVWIEAFNKAENNGKDWKPDFTDGTVKYGLYAWIKNNPNGVGFVVVYAYYDYACTYSGCGSRHVCKSIEVWNKVVEIAKDDIDTIWTE